MPLFKRKHQDAPHHTEEPRIGENYTTTDRMTGGTHDRSGYDGIGTSGLGNATHNNRGYENYNEPTGMHHNNNTMGPGYTGTNTATTGMHHNRMDEGPMVPPASTVSGPGNTSSVRGTTGSTTGKIERKLGDALGSRALREKGMEKEREALAFRVQSDELAEAERLEQEAKMRRERAVAHGAHPDNKHLGGVSHI